MQVSNVQRAQRPQTRAFTKLHQIEVRNFTLDDLDAISSRRRRPKVVQKATTLEPPEYRGIGGAKTTTRSAPQLLKQRRTGPQASQTSKGAWKTPSRQNFAQRSRLGRIERLEADQETGHTIQKSQLDAETHVHLPSPDQTDTIRSWLEKVTPSASLSSKTVPVAQCIVHSVSPLTCSDMETSSSANTTGSSVVVEDARSTQASTVKVRKERGLTMEALEVRGITDLPSNDERISQLGLDGIIDSAVRSVGAIEFRSLSDYLESVVKEFKRAFEKDVNVNGLPIYQRLKKKVDSWRPDSATYRNLPPMSDEEFQLDREVCDNGSEANLQRTIMISIIDRYDFRKVFSYSCEEVWSISGAFMIPSTVSLKVPQPKPDLAISFCRDALLCGDKLRFPLELRQCLHPGGMSARQRWFPFFFMEAKRDDHSLRNAFESSLHSASQALFNIYQWMSRDPQLKEQFFADVRVFSVVLNNEKLILRAHRAELTEDGSLAYSFANISQIVNYDAYNACHLIKSVLTKYAEPRLLPILRSAFRKVAGLDPAIESGEKRKRDATTCTAEPADEQLQSENPEPPRLQQTSTGLSFATEELDLIARNDVQRGSTTVQDRGRPKRSRRGRR